MACGFLGWEGTARTRVIETIQTYECTGVQKDTEECGNEYSAVSQQVGVGRLTWEGPQEEPNLKSNFERMEK